MFLQDIAIIVKKCSPDVFGVGTKCLLAFSHYGYSMYSNFRPDPVSDETKSHFKYSPETFKPIKTLLAVQSSSKLTKHVSKVQRKPFRETFEIFGNIQSSSPCRKNTIYNVQRTFNGILVKLTAVGQINLAVTLPR